eukprot:TRINITY_DN14663_c0_g1_i3.p1 TRINITY_DN14663_c0_g1~~TRINITY_DN14663_c0_g1_i3.p1  ORF type:complete len:504 (-),score=92.95 TRINITY_DN14663_c0_g1_i3:550-2061(-)
MLVQKAGKVTTSKMERLKDSFMHSVRVSRVITGLNYATKLRKQKFNAFLIQKRSMLAEPEIMNFASTTPVKIEEIVMNVVGSSELICHSLKELRQTVCGPEKYTEILLKLNIVEKLAPLLDSVNSEIVLEAEWILINLAATHSEFSQDIISSKTHLKLFKLIHSFILSVQQHAMWILGNVAGSGSRGRRELLQAGVLKEIADLLETPIADTSLIQKLCWLMFNLLKEKYEPRVEEVKNFVELMNSLLISKDKNLKICSLIGLQAVTNGSVRIIRYVLDTIQVKELIECLKREEARNEALKVAGNMCTGCKKCIKKLLDHGFVPVISEILTAKNDNEALKECCWLLSNIALGPPSHIQCLIENLIPTFLCAIVTAAPNFKVKREAAYALVNMCERATVLQLYQIRLEEVMSALVLMLNVEDAKMIIVILKVLEKIFEIGGKEVEEFERLGGVKKLEELQLHPNVDVINKGCELLDKYFDCESLQIYDEPMEENGISTKNNMQID